MRVFVGFGRRIMGILRWCELSWGAFSFSFLVKWVCFFQRSECFWVQLFMFTCHKVSIFVRNIRNLQEHKYVP